MTAIELLKNKTGYKNIRIVQRGNKAIWSALQIGKKLGYSEVLVQDQGGWITYLHFPKRLKLKVVEVNTNNLLLDMDDLRKKISEKSILLINAMPGYAIKQPMEEIAKIARQRKALLIEDITATINQKPYGDILVASFGNDKLVNYGRLGMIAAKKDYLDLILVKEEKYDDELLLQKIKNIDKRYLSFIKINKKIKDELRDFDIVSGAGEGINVIARFKNEKEKEQIISFCGKNKYHFVVCPNYSKIKENAISIEVKKL